MSDPNTPFSARSSDPAGVGPYQFDVPALDPSERWTLDLRQHQRGRFVTLSPAGYDSLSVTNTSSSQTLKVLINESTRLDVPPNTTQSISTDGMYRFDVTNLGSTATASDAVRLNVLKEAYGADEQARQRRNESPIRSMLRNFTGV